MRNFQNTSVPKTFDDMFLFNAAVMGFGTRQWMMEILSSFDAVVSNAANSYRLQEECDVLALRMAKFKAVFCTRVMNHFRAKMAESWRPNRTQSCRTSSKPDEIEVQGPIQTLDRGTCSLASSLAAILRCKLSVFIWCCSGGGPGVRSGRL